MSAPLRTTQPRTARLAARETTNASTTTRPWALWWMTSLAWWGLQFVVTLLLDRGTESGMPATLLRANAASTVLWVGLTVFVFWLAERTPLDRHSWQRSAPLALGGAVVVVVVRAVVVTVANPIIGWYSEQPPFETVLLTSFGNNFFLYWLVLGAGHGLAYARRVRERDEQLAVAELHHLKAQLQPHFLFNTLNTISTFVRTDPETAVKMIAQLGTLLRHALQQEGVQEVPLEEELSIVGAYLDIERQRFDERLQVVWRIDPSLLRARVPHLLLQPLVENAIRHGISPARDGGTVRIAATCDAGRVQLVVEDDGEHTGALPAPSQMGIGLTNTRRRLQQLYGAAHTFEMATVQPSGFRVLISLPFREIMRPAISSAPYGKRS